MFIRRLGATLVLAACTLACALPAIAGATTSGSVTASLTEPVARSVTRQGGVDCAVHGSTYLATATAAVRDYRITVTDTVSGYDGPGSYGSTAKVTIVYVPTNIVRTYSRTVQVQIGATEAESGSAPFAVVFSGAKAPRLAGRSVAGEVTWQCPS